MDSIGIQEFLYKKLTERKNVEIYTNADVSAIELNKNIKGNVKQITTGKGSKLNSFEVDSFVLCNGW